MSKENYKNYFNGGCLTCMFAERDERGRYLGHCSGFSNCSYEQYKGETDITEEEKDEKIADLEQQLAEKEAELKEQKEKYENLYKCYKNTSSEDLKDKYHLAEEIEELKQQLTEKEKELKKFKRVGATPKQLQRAYQERYKYNERCDKLKNQHIQNKIKFAVEQLEKVKEEFISEDWDLYDTADLLEQVCELRNKQIKFIDNKINKLKEIK